MTTLLRNPATFEGQTIRVTGQYRSLPLLVCGDTIHRSPATWKLVFGDVETFAAGFDEALRPLAASGLSLTIEGRWQKWEGPVGCGRRAPAQEIWYLAASRIVSPNPLVKSDTDEGVIVLLPTSTPAINVTVDPDVEVTLTVDPANTAESPDSPTNTPSPSPTFQLIPTPQPGASATNAPAPTATSSTGGSSTSTPTLSATATTEISGTAVTETPAGTPDGTPSTTPSGTATTSGSTPSATSTPVDQGVLDFDSIEKHTLPASGPHSWRLNPTGNEPIIITVGSTLNLNIKLDLLDQSGTVVATANQGGPGKPETINYTTPNPTGELTLVISSSTASAGAYIVLLFDSDSLPVVAMQDTIIYGSGGSGTTAEDVDHFWNFEGQAGDIISIDVSPTNSTGDLIIYLIGPDGDELEFINEAGVGSSESLTNYTLPSAGFYSIGIGENNFSPIGYTLLLLQ